MKRIFIMMALPILAGAATPVPFLGQQEQQTEQQPRRPTPDEVEAARRREEAKRAADERARAQAEAQRKKSYEQIFGPVNPTPQQQRDKREAELAAAEKNYTEMKEEAAELATLSQKVRDEINLNGKHVISVQMLKDLEAIEKLARKVRNRAKDQ